MRFFRGAMFLALWVLCRAGVAAEAAPPPAAPSSAPADGPAESDSLRIDVEDPGFEQFAGLEFLGRALRSLDAAQMADATLLLAEGERVLGRPHRAASADDFFQATLRVAVENRDQATLDRLGTAVKQSHRIEWAQAIQSARKLASGERRLSVGPDVSVSELSAENIVLYNALLSEIRIAKVSGDDQDLAQLRREVERSSELHPKQQAHLTRVIGEGIAAIAQNRKGDAISKLASVSRAWFGSSVRSVYGPTALKNKAKGTFYVFLDRPATSATQVRLQSSHPAELRLPGNVSVASGQTRGAFVATAAFRTLKKPQSARITAVGDRSSAQTGLSVYP